MRNLHLVKYIKYLFIEEIHVSSKGTKLPRYSYLLYRKKLLF